VYVSHEETVKDDDELLLIVKFNDAACTHPEAFKDVEVYVPVFEYVLPFAIHTYESHEVTETDDDEL